MEPTTLPLPSEIWAATPAAAQALILGQRERIRELEARLGQTSSNSSRPPSSPAERRASCWAHLKRDFQALVDRSGEAEPIGCWGLAEIARLFALWHVRPGREAPAQAPDRHKGRREVLLRRCIVTNARRPCDAQVPLPRRAKG